MDRKEFLKRLGMLTVGASLIGVDVSAMTAEPTAATAPQDTPQGGSKTHPDLDFPIRSLKAQTAGKVVTAIIIGAGSRGTTYGKYATQFPDTMKL